MNLHKGLTISMFLRKLGGIHDICKKDDLFRYFLKAFFMLFLFWRIDIVDLAEFGVILSVIPAFLDQVLTT